MTVALAVVAAVLAVCCAALVVALVRERRSTEPGRDVAEPVEPRDQAPSEPQPAEPPEVAPDLLLERLRAVVEHLEDAVVVRDGAGAELYRNAAARRLAESRSGRVLVAAAIEELLDEAVRGRRARRVVDLFGPPAESFVVTASPFRRLDAEGGAAVDGAVAVVEDRSLQRRTDVVRRDFVANISHELKTPIGAMGLLAETLRDEAGGESPDAETVGRLADRMVGESDRAASTLDDLLELSRIEFGDDSEFEDVSIAHVVEDATSRLSSVAERAGVSVEVHVPAGLAVMGDRRQLTSAVTNLVDNAIKYSTPPSRVEVSAEEAADSVLVVVADQGIGVPRRDLDRIFERFYRVDRGRSRATGGTGLGLAIVRHVASNHDGEVLVESAEGVGSTFTLVLPRRRGGGAGGAGPGHTGLARDVQLEAIT